MKKSNIFQFYGFLFLAILFTSCEDKVELDLPEGEKRLVVEGFITDEERSHFVFLTYTSAYFSNGDSPKVTDATVVLRDDTGAEIVLDEFAPGVYTYPNGGEIGRTYHLEITLPDGERYRSNPELLKEVSPILDIKSPVSARQPNALFDEDPDQIYEVVIDTFEPEGVGDYYRWRSIVNGVLKSQPFDISVASDEFVDGNPILNFNVTNQLYFQGDSVTIIQESISRGLYDFLVLVQAQTAFVGSPFDTPPVPIKGNVINTENQDLPALGYFGATARSRASIVVGP